MHIGFIGLGHLGKAIAGRLLDCDHTLTVWNRSSAKAEGMDAAIESSPAEVSARAEIIFLCLFDSDAVRQVLTGEKGVLAGNAAGKVIVDLTTNHFHDVLDFHELCSNAGAHYMESPVLGSVVPAAQGALTVLVSGKEEIFERVRPLLDDIGKHVFFLDRPALATKMKLINNLVLGTFMTTLAEALAFGEKSGIDRADILDILSVGGGNSLVLNAKKNKLLEQDFSVHFSNALILKDLHCLQDLAYETKTALFSAAMTRELYALACEKGLDQEDFSAVYKLFRPE